MIGQQASAYIISFSRGIGEGRRRMRKHEVPSLMDYPLSLILGCVHYGYV